MPETLTAQYTHTFERYFTLIRARRQRDRTWYATPYLVVPCMALALLLGLSWYDGVLARLKWDSSSIAQLAGIVLACVLATCVMVFLVDLLFDKLIYRWVFKRSASANKPLSIAITDLGVEWTAPALGGQIGWAAIKNITVLSDGTAAVAWVGKLEGILLPADSFSSRAGFDAAVERIKEQCRVRT